MSRDTIGKELKKLEAVIRVHHGIGINLELDIISSMALKELNNVIDCDGCAILTLERDKMKILAQQGLPADIEANSFDTDTPAIHIPVQNKRAFFTGEIINDLEAGALCCGRPVKSLISVPIVLNGEAKGVICLDSLKKNAFNDGDVKFVELIAEEISLTIERSLIFSQVQEMLGRPIDL